jgi:hypothetical protein
MSYAGKSVSFYLCITYSRKELLSTDVVELIVRVLHLFQEEKEEIERYEDAMRKQEDRRLKEKEKGKEKEKEKVRKEKEEDLMKKEKEYQKKWFLIRTIIKRGLMMLLNFVKDGMYYEFLLLFCDSVLLYFFWHEYLFFFLVHFFGRQLQIHSFFPRHLFSSQQHALSLCT